VRTDIPLGVTALLVDMNTECPIDPLD